MDLVDGNFWQAKQVGLHWKWEMQISEYLQGMRLEPTSKSQPLKDFQAGAFRQYGTQ
jgi:hypothetical protein